MDQIFVIVWLLISALLFWINKSVREKFYAHKFLGKIFHLFMCSIFLLPLILFGIFEIIFDDRIRTGVWSFIRGEELVRRETVRIFWSSKYPKTINKNWQEYGF